MLVSVILPIRNEAACIEEVLAAVLAQDYPRELMEVLVVDGMSEDGTREIVRRLAAQDARLRMLDNPRRITPAALNLGIRNARGEVLVRVDGHGVLPPNYLRECVARLPAEVGSPKSEAGSHGPDVRPLPSALCPPPSDSPASSIFAIGGAWDCVGRGVVGEAIALAASSRFGVGNARYRTCRPEDGPLLTDSVPFWTMRREVFERLGLFREEMPCHEDYEFNHRLRQAGGRILLLPWLRAKYYVRSTLGGLARQYWRYGFWKGRFLRSHPESLKFRHVVPPVFVAALVIAAGASLFNPVGLRCLGALAGLYGLFLSVATAGLFASGSREREFADRLQSEIGNRKPEIGNQASAPRPPASGLCHSPSSVLVVLFLPVVLVTLHLCWGTGVWAGLLRGGVRGQAPSLGP